MGENACISIGQKEHSVEEEALQEVSRLRLRAETNLLQVRMKVMVYTMRREAGY